MITNSIQFTIFLNNLDVFDKQIRRSIEDDLQDFNFTFFSKPIQPPQALKINYGDFPFIIGQTSNGHSQIFVTSQNLQLFVNFDENYFNEREKCFEYAFKKIDMINQVLKQLKANYQYSGLVIQYLFDNFNNPVDVLNRDSVSLCGKREFHNFLKKFSIIDSDIYYINFEMVTLYKLELNKQIIGVTVDINDRYGSERPDNSCNYNNVLRMKNLHESISEPVLQRLVEQGELKLNV